MTTAQAAALVAARSTGLLAKLAAMFAANEEREQRGMSIAYGEEAFHNELERAGVSEKDIAELYASCSDK